MSLISRIQQLAHNVRGECHDADYDGVQELVAWCITGNHDSDLQTFR